MFESLEEEGGGTMEDAHLNEKVEWNAERDHDDAIFRMRTSLSLPSLLFFNFNLRFHCSSFISCKPFLTFLHQYLLAQLIL